MPNKKSYDWWSGMPDIIAFGPFPCWFSIRERYRDLLQASTSIIAMSDSSIHVVSVISEMKRVAETNCHMTASKADTKQSADGEWFSPGSLAKYWVTCRQSIANLAIFSRSSQTSFGLFGTSLAIIGEKEVPPSSVAIPAVSSGISFNAGRRNRRWYNTMAKLWDQC